MGYPGEGWQPPPEHGSQGHPPYPPQGQAGGYGQGGGSGYPGGWQQPAGEPQQGYGGQNPPLGGGSYYGGGQPPGGPGGPDGFGPYGPPPPRNKAPLIIAGVAAAVLVVGGGGVALALGLHKGEHPKSHRPKAHASSFTPPTPSYSTASDSPSYSPSPGVGGGGFCMKLCSRKTDPKRLTLSEVFKHHVTGSTNSYRLDGRSSTSSCGTAIRGSALASALREHGCNQLLRATYERSDGTIIGTTGIANLSTYSGAKTVLKAAGKHNQSVLPLPGSGRSAHIGHTNAYGVRQVRGHYLILSWVQFADHSATASDESTLSQFHQDIVNGSISTALSSRMITGKPS